MPAEVTHPGLTGAQSYVIDPQGRLHLFLCRHRRRPRIAEDPADDLRTLRTGGT